MENMMNLRTASQLVADDVRLTYPAMSDREALEHAANVGDPEAFEGNDELDEAYRMVARAYGEGGFPFPARQAPVEE